jgi:hypothetical protein
MHGCDGGTACKVSVGDMGGAYLSERFVNNLPMRGLAITQASDRFRPA